MSIKDFIKIASVYGEETKTNAQKLEEGLLDDIATFFGFEDEEDAETTAKAIDTAVKKGGGDTSAVTKKIDSDNTATGRQDSPSPEKTNPDANNPNADAAIDDKMTSDNAATNDTSTVGDDSDDDSTSVGSAEDELDAFGGPGPDVDTDASQQDDAEAQAEKPASGGSLLGRKLETALTRVGHDPNGLDGKYGQGTFAAVQAFQKANGLQADGMAGPETMAALKKALDDKFAQSQADQAVDKKMDGDNAAKQDTSAEVDPDATDPRGDQTNPPPSKQGIDGPADAAAQEVVPSRLRIRKTIAPEVEKLLQLASVDFTGLMAIMEGKGLAEALDPPQKAQLQKYLDQIRASAERDPEVNVEFADLIKRMESALGIQKTVKQTGGDGPEEINPDDEAQDIANVKAIQQRQAQADTSAADNQAAADAAQDQGNANYADDPQATDTRDGDDLGTAPTAPKVSDERGMQSGGSIVNFNVSQFKSNGTYIDIPDRNNPGFVVRVYGPEANLQAFIDKDPRGKGKTIQGGTKQSGVPDAERDARERGVQVAHKEYDMTKKINEASMNISMNGNNAAEVAELIGILKNAGMSDAAPVSDMPMYKDGHDDMVSKMQMMDEPPAETPCGMGEEAVDEDWDNTPDETYADHHTMTKDLSGGINRRKPKGSERAKDPAVHQTVETSIKDQLWAALNEKMATEGRGRGKNKKMKEVDIKTTEGRGKGKGRGRGKG
jgi:peptidoglycan hydrolase-like protein with peptidoglycan-binding domain